MSYNGFFRFISWLLNVGYELNQQKEGLDPNANPNCKACHGYGMVNVGSICYGFGAEPKLFECMCILYKKLKMEDNNLDN